MLWLLQRPAGRLMSGGAAAEAATEPKRCKNCDNTGIHFLGKTCTCPFGKKILNDSSDEEMICAGSSEATAAAASAAARREAQLQDLRAAHPGKIVTIFASALRQKIGEKIGVLMSSLDSDEEPLDPPGA